MEIERTMRVFRSHGHLEAYQRVVLQRLLIIVTMTKEIPIKDIRRGPGNSESVNT